MSRGKQPTDDHGAHANVPLPEPIVDSFSPDIVLMYLGSLVEARRRDTLDVEAFEQKVRQLLFHDADGQLWAPGARSMKWYRRAGEKWVEETPPAALFDRPGTSLLGQLHAPSPVSRAASAPPAAATPPAARPSPPPAAAPPPKPPAPAKPAGLEISRGALVALASQLRGARAHAPSANYDAVRRAFVAHDAAGTAWTVNPDTSLLACRVGGAWVEVATEAGPVSVFIDERVVDAVRGLAREAAAAKPPPPPPKQPPRPAPAKPAALPPTTPVAPLCAHCGQPLIPGKKFCTACGRSVKVAEAPASAPPPSAARACPNCGKSVSSRSRFCPSCGKTL